MESFTIEESQCISENSFLINIFDDIGFKSGGLFKGDRIHRIVLIHVSPSFFLYPTDSARGTAGFSTDTIQVTPTERIFMSLLCPLPNEQDFAINVCSLLAIENRKPFALRQCPRIIDALLAHAGVFSQGVHWSAIPENPSSKPHSSLDKLENHSRNPSSPPYFAANLCWES